MENCKKAIILDIDETLAYGTFYSNGSMMTLRPNIDKLIDELQKAKGKGIEIILTSSSSIEWVERFLKLKPKFNDILDKISYENYDTEMDNYESILLMCGNKHINEDIIEKQKKDSRDKDITYFSGFTYNTDDVNLISMLKYSQYAQNNTGIAKRLQNYIRHIQKEPGCIMMCKEIDDFLNKEYTPGIKIDDEKHVKNYNSYISVEKKLYKDLITDARKYEKQVDPRLYSTVLYLDINKVEEYIKTDKNYPYEAMNVPKIEEKKRAIILDLNETLICGAFNSKYSMMTLRPNIDRLIKKLESAKAEGVDVILHTMAPKKWVDRFLTLKPEFERVFDKIYTRQDQLEWMINERTKENSKAEDFLETNVGLWKPLTELGYDSMLVIDDNRQEKYKLESAFKETGYELQKDVSYFSGFGYNIDIKPETIIKCQKIAKIDQNVAKNFNIYIEALKREPGCLLMVDAIDVYMNKPFKPGITVLDNKYEDIYKKYKRIMLKANEKLDNSIWEYEEKAKKENANSNTIQGNGIPVGDEEIERIFQTDKSYPYEGIETYSIENAKKQQLNMLIAKALQLQVKIKDAKKIEDAYESNTGKKINNNDFEI